MHKRFISCISPEPRSLSGRLTKRWSVPATNSLPDLRGLVVFPELAPRLRAAVPDTRFGVPFAREVPADGVNEQRSTASVFPRLASETLRQLLPPCGLHGLDFAADQPLDARARAAPAGEELEAA